MIYKWERINHLLIVIIILISITISGCTEQNEPYSPIKYIVKIETNDKAVVYLPVLLDLPDNTVADLVSSFNIDKKKSQNIEITYDVIDTIHGKALKVYATENVTIKAVSSNKYYKNHPEIPITRFIPGTEGEQKFFNMSMKTNEGSYWAYLDTNPDNQVKVLIYAGADINVGGEYWTSQPDGSDNRNYFFTMKPGWNKIGLRRSIIYY